MIQTWTEVKSPSGCTWCGIDKRVHMQRWHTKPGWHGWVAPTDEQIKARMLARRAEPEFNANVHAVAEILRAHQYDDAAGPDMCHCGGRMGDQENHQAMAIVEAGWMPATTDTRYER